MLHAAVQTLRRKPAWQSTDGQAAGARHTGNKELAVPRFSCSELPGDCPVPTARPPSTTRAAEAPGPRRGHAVPLAVIEGAAGNNVGCSAAEVVRPAHAAGLVEVDDESRVAAANARIWLASLVLKRMLMASFCAPME